MIRMAEQSTREGVELEGNYSLEEISEMVSTMKKLMRIRDVVLRVNREYIRSAAQSDAYRTEPPFLLQGSYRNMNRIAEKVLPIMNDQELQTADRFQLRERRPDADHQRRVEPAEVQGTHGRADPEEAQRWASIKRTFTQNVKMHGVAAGDQAGQVIVQLRDFSDGLHAIRETMGEGVKHLAKRDTDDKNVVLSALLQHVGELRRGLEAIGQSLKEAAAQAAQRPAEPAVLAAPAELPPQKLIVQHRVPRELLDVVRSQFEVMNTWLEPLLSASQDQRRDLDKLQNAVQTCLANYYGLLQQLETADTRGGR